MNINKCIKESFVVIGKEGSTNDGAGFIQNLWEDANSHFHEVEQLAKKDDKGNIVGIWGAMSDMSHSFLPWEDGFTKGLYLAGVECLDTSEAPAGWTKWVIPILLVGAVHDFTCMETGKSYLFFPIRAI